MTAAALPTSEEVARGFMAPLWNLRTLPESIAVWRTRGLRPRCRPCTAHGRCQSLGTATNPYCLGHQGRAGR